MASVVSHWSVPVTDLLRHPGTRREIEVSGELGDIAVTASRVPPGAEVAVSAKQPDVFKVGGAYPVTIDPLT